MRTVDPKKHQAKRQHIIDSAAALFAERGYDGATTAAICEAAGISPGNLFHYFGSKREVFAAIFEDEGSEKAERLAAAQASDDPWMALLDVVDLLAEPATSPLAPPLVMVAMVQAHSDPELAEMLSRDDTDEHAAIMCLVDRGREAGQIDPALNPRDAASWIMALIGALFIRAATDPQFNPAEQLPTLRLIIQRFLRPHQ